MLRFWSILSALAITMGGGAEAAEPVEVVEIQQIQSTYAFSCSSEQYLTGLVLPEEKLVLDSIPSDDDIVWTAERKQQREQKRQQQEAEKNQAAELASQGNAAQEGNRRYLGVYKLTAYCPCKKCCGKNPSDPGYGLTASGEVAREGVTIAADKLPFGTRVYIEGVGERVVQDRGGAIKGNRIDIFCSSHERCFQNPNYVGSAKVWILE